MISKTTAKSRGVRLGNFPQIRAILDEETGTVWSGKKTAKEALDQRSCKRRQRICCAKLRQAAKQVSWRPTDAGSSAPRRPAPRGHLRYTESSQWKNASVFRSAWLPWAADRPAVASSSASSSSGPPARRSGSPRNSRMRSGPRSTSSDSTTSAASSRTRPTSHRSETTLIFSALVDRVRPVISLLLAVFADRVIARRDLLQDRPDPALCGGARGRRRAVVVSCSSRRSDSSPTALARCGIDWNHVLNGSHAMALVVMAAVWKQICYNFLFFFAGLQSIPKSLIEAAAIDGAGPVRRFCDHRSFRCCRRPPSSCW